MRAKSTEKFANANINERSKMTINERMFTLIKDNNYKKADLARILNINTSVIATWEKRGTNPPAEYLIRICNFLDISIYELLGVEDKNNIQAAYDVADPGTQAAVRKLLDIEEGVIDFKDWIRKHKHV